MDLWDTKVLNKIDKCGRELSRWSKKCFGSVRRELEKKNESKYNMQRRRQHELGTLLV